MNVTVTQSARRHGQNSYQTRLEISALDLWYQYYMPYLHGLFLLLLWGVLQVHVENNVL